MTKVDKIKNDLHKAADHFILGEESEALTLLAEISEQFISVFDTLSPELQTELNQIIEATITTQSRQDWLGVADYLKFELIELVDKIEIELAR
ncbi:hypothetical protein FM038_016000 [Shewanella eurypsychrophilus]|uniref:Uncharacterized protein n=1 Tax=Shewanella eurypsychrophilus TaxID=2593656 RepID=A0ABX6VA58_9GAMM|nr:MULTISPECIES: hypothetical protein [Shewanella]QFU23525.1 hypothetical protein FS418_17800 [Shewanella sp. YLB-09]QPG58751.1 hypothetical protein FM038_016000 [Shewanella eurypsychrophilus]